MCRNIRTLFNFEPPATEDEIRASALQFVRKLSGFNFPPRRTRTRSTRGGGGVGRGPPAAAVAGDDEPAARPRGRGREGARPGARAICLGGLRRVSAPSAPANCTQPTMRDLALSMSFLEKKSSGFTLSTG